MIAKWMPKVIEHCMTINLWAPRGVTFWILCGFVRSQFPDEFKLEKIGSQIKKIRNKVPGVDGEKTGEAELTKDGGCGEVNLLLGLES